jgi:hypothetical protein
LYEHGQDPILKLSYKNFKKHVCFEGNVKKSVVLICVGVQMTTTTTGDDEDEGSTEGQHEGIITMHFYLF